MKKEIEFIPSKGFSLTSPVEPFKKQISDFVFKVVNTLSVSVICDAIVVVITYKRAFKSIHNHMNIFISVILYPFFRFL